MKQILGSFGRAAAASVVMISLAAPMQATVVATYNNRATWEGSLTAVQTVDFNETMASGGNTFQSYSNSGGYTDPSSILRFLGPNQINPTISSHYELFRTTLSPSGARVLRGPTWGGGAGDERLVINFLATAAKGFGIDIASSVAGITYQFTVDGVAVTPTVVAGTTSTFFGLRTDTNISQIIIRAVGPPNTTESYFDNASIGALGGGDPPPEVPEPSTMIFLTTGLSALAWTRYRRGGSQPS